VYALGYCLPMFMYFMYVPSKKSEEESGRTKYLYSSILVSIFFFAYEILQTRSGMIEYIKDFWNWVDITGFISFWMLCYYNLVST
jgi:hypothetical protein